MHIISDFQKKILQGIADELPDPKPFDHSINHAPNRRNNLCIEEKQLAVRNALRYFHKKHHHILSHEFMSELNRYAYL